MPNRRELGYVSSGASGSVPANTYGVATGGSSSSITVSGQNYTLLTFTSDANLVVSQAGLFDVLLIGGGGSGGSGQGANDQVGGGGGGGEVVGITSTVTLYLPAATYALDVGAGGAGVVHANIGNSGAYSKIADIIYALGGGNGGGISASNNVVYAIGRYGYPGGNNGGSAVTDDYTYVRRALSPNSYLGGIGTQLTSGNTNDTPTGGGGGAGGAGGDASGSTGGAGGNGKDISPFIGGSTYYAGAGAGGCGATAGAAGNGGVAGVTGTTPNNGVNYGAAGSGVRGGPSTSGSGAAGAIYVRFKV
jgi:hypothetical protein